MIRSVRAWAIFLFVVGIPTLLAVFVARLSAHNEEEGRRRRLADERVETAARLRDTLELTVRRGEDALRAVPASAHASDAAAMLQSANLRFARVFVRQPGEPNPANAWMYRTLQTEGHDVMTLGAPGAGDLMVTRRLDATLEIGFVIDEASVTTNAGTMLPLHQALVRRASASSGEGRRKVNPWAMGPFSVFTANPSISDRSLAVSPNLIFDVEPRDPAMEEHVIRSAGVSVLLRWAIPFSFMVGLAFVLFSWSQRAQRLAELRTDFVAAISHELRTPLASVRMFAELLEAQAVPADERAEVEVALATEARRLHVTLDRMLRFGALARGKLVVNKATVSVAALVRECAEKARMPVRVEVDPDLVADVDAGLVGLALDNLIANAIKYAPGEIVVRGHLEGERVVLDVVDRGPGLDRRAQRRVFLPFERADDRLSRATEGTGVGLSLVRGIARAHGGDATVTSAPGAGATFTLRLPRS